MISWNAIDAAISAATGLSFRTAAHHEDGGGCINRTYAIEGTAGRYFVKLNRPGTEEMFAAEAEGLHAIRAGGAIRAPEPICRGSTEDHAFLILEHLPLGQQRAGSAALLGAQLAALHRHTRAEFGWHRDNTIGTTPQINQSGTEWSEFWRDRRLAYQLQRAAERGCDAALRRKGERLLSVVSDLLQSHRPAASLLHGDLWSGNYGTLENGQPVIFDPAVYYGDRETDLAMTELFGGFPSAFYAAYREHYPLDEGYTLRKTLYNLYHVLNHYNLFGGGYASQAERMIDTLLNELR